ncbi:MAG: hypothetical protein D6736_11170 [Nitrospinota bacterium]|nr:MAG: hypothetical protein D6736_11170 [Nitrospinota bacterium]
MARVPINPGRVDWSGENPGMYLKREEDGPYTTLISFFRVIYSPYGVGHAVVVLTDPTGTVGGPDQVNACYTDNRDLAQWLVREFVSYFAPFQENPHLPRLPFRDATSFTRSGDTRRSWTEAIQGPDIDIQLTWDHLQEPFVVEYEPEHSATGKHDMLSLFIPATEATVIINGKKREGRPFPRNMAGKQSTTAFLAFSETWIRR